LDFGLWIAVVKLNREHKDQSPKTEDQRPN
jgi:hypothetical protein